MKSLTNYILERFISTNKDNQRYLLYYPYIGDLAWANKNCDEKHKLPKKDILDLNSWLYSEEELKTFKLQVKSIATYLVYLPDDLSKDEFIEQWKNGKITWFDFRKWEKYNGEVLERFVSTVKPQRFVFYYPYDDDLNWAKENYPKEMYFTDIGYIWIFDEKQASKISNTSPATIIGYIPTESNKDEFLKLCCKGDIEAVDLRTKFEKYKLA